MPTTRIDRCDGALSQSRGAALKPECESLASAGYWRSSEFITRVFTIALGWLFGFALSELEALAPHKILVFFSFAGLWTAAGLYGLWHEYRRFIAS